MNDKVCRRCKWFKSAALVGYEGWCRRFPEWLQIFDNDHYCGEWKDKSDD